LLDTRNPMSLVVAHVGVNPFLWLLDTRITVGT